LSQEIEGKFCIEQKISHLPPVLSIQIRRFRYSKNNKMPEKVCTRVNFPLILDVSDICLQETQITATTEYDTDGFA
ncbi:hypothetical protein PMAYCL1PPCAC_10472, partial [Pristionchus mayeri]